MKQTAKQAITRYNQLDKWINVLTTLTDHPHAPLPDSMEKSYNQLIEDMEHERKNIKMQLLKQGITI